MRLVGCLLIVAAISGCYQSETYVIDVNALDGLTHLPPRKLERTAVPAQRSLDGKRVSLRGEVARAASIVSADEDHLLIRASAYSSRKAAGPALLSVGIPILVIGAYLLADGADCEAHYATEHCDIGVVLMGASTAPLVVGSALLVTGALLTALPDRKVLELPNSRPTRHFVDDYEVRPPPRLRLAATALEF